MHMLFVLGAKALAAAGLTAASGTAAAGATAAGATATAGGAATAASSGSALLSSLRLGMTAVSALSGFSMARAQAEAQRTEAFGQDMQARQEFTQAQEKSTAIQRAFNETAENQLAIASASGISLTSGSVIAARNQARDVADRQVSTARDSATVNAMIRRANAAALRASASTTATGGLLSAAGDVGLGLLDKKKVR